MGKSRPKGLKYELPSPDVSSSSSEIIRSGELLVKCRSGVTECSDRCPLDWVGAPPGEQVTLEVYVCEWVGGGGGGWLEVVVTTGVGAKPLTLAVSCCHLL